MKKKIITIVFTLQRSSALFNNLTRDLTAVFGDSIEIRTVYTSRLMPDEIIEGDVVLLLRPSIMWQMKSHVSDPKKIVIVTRTVTEDMIYRLYDIPKGTDVLVVNDSPETTNETVSMLYQLGITHINLIPYLGAETDLSDIQVAVTPGEAHLVPSAIRNVVDIGDRRLDMQTYLDIFPLLEITSDEIKQALVRYADTTIELHNGVKKRYVKSYMLNETLKQIISLQSLGIIVTDAEYNLRFWNPEAEKFLEKTPRVQKPLSLYLSPEALNRLTIPGFIDDLMVLGSRQVMVSRIPLTAMEQVSGYCLTFESAAHIRKSGSDLSRRLKNQGLTARYRFEDILCHNAAMRQCISMAEKVAGTDYTVLITGQTGTGKEMFAQAIHNASPRRNKPFVAVNCAALPESLLESELFGYEEGAFTGAKRGGKLGLFEQADGGTIFLDEIGDMPYPLQSKLLRVLQEQQIVRLGGSNVINIDVRIITATNCDLLQHIREHRFREDLFYRLSVFPIELIPLCQRKEDIVPLFCHIGNIEEPSLPQHIKARLNSYTWPGNVRELRNAADYYKLMGTVDCIKFISNLEGHKESGEVNHTLPAGENQDAGSTASVTTAKLRSYLLQLLQLRYERGQSSGRSSLLKNLRADGIAVSEKRLEKVLELLKEEGAITRSRGRAGIQITEAGLRIAESESQAVKPD